MKRLRHWAFGKVKTLLLALLSDSEVAAVLGHQQLLELHSRTESRLQAAKAELAQVVRDFSFIGQTAHHEYANRRSREISSKLDTL